MGFSTSNAAYPSAVRLKASLCSNGQKIFSLSGEKKKSESLSGSQQFLGPFSFFDVCVSQGQCGRRLELNRPVEGVKGCLCCSRGSHFEQYCATISVFFLLPAKHGYSWSDAASQISWMGSVYAMW